MEQLSKEEIISEVFDMPEFQMADIPIMDYQKNAVCKAMDIYAKQTAIVFQNWVLGSEYRLNPNCEETRWRHINEIKNSESGIITEGITTEKLYDIYAQSLNK